MQAELLKVTLYMLKLVVNQTGSFWLSHVCLKASGACYLTLQKRAARRQVKAASFNKLLLRFGHLSKGFAKCKKVYHSLDSDGNEVIDLQELAEGCNKLGFDISSDVIDKVFQATDLDGNKVIDFREFIVVLALLYMISTEVSFSNFSLYIFTSHVVYSTCC